MRKYTVCKMCGAKLPEVKGKSFFCSDKCRVGYRLMQLREYNRKYYLIHKNAKSENSEQD